MDCATWSSWGEKISIILMLGGAPGAYDKGELQKEKIIT
uniref:Uncharacterized protein n=1 Tax=Anguilla anguilla TaxID=7936 RepID=A0A0E9Y0G6_ANGAN